VAAPPSTMVTEAAGGSTAAAGWFTLGQAAELRLTEIARTAVRGLLRDGVS
jgi:8-oxo-dGTP diphosphatase